MNSVPKPDFLPLKRLAVEYMAEVEAARERGDDSGDAGHDLEHYIFEAALEAVYGPRVWDYINGGELPAECVPCREATERAGLKCGEFGPCHCPCHDGGS